MMKNKTAVYLILMLVLIIFIQSEILSAGIYMIDPDGRKTYISNGKLKETDQEDGMIMDSHTNNFTYYNTEKMIYTSGKISDFCQAMKDILNQMLESMSPEMKELFGVGQPQDPPKIKVISEGDGGMIAGYKTEKYKILTDDQVYEVVWLATDKSLVKEFESLVGMMTEFQKCSKTMDFGAPPVELSQEYINLMKKGLTLKSITYQDEDENISTNTESIEIREISDSEFQVPAGYEKMSFSEFFGSQMSGE
jgi:hypothetical protein